MKTAEDFQKIAAERGVTRFYIHRCSICGVPVGFMINYGQVEYDSSCDCAWCHPRPSNWQEIADHYNRNVYASDVATRMENPKFREYVEEMNKVWGFESIENA